MADGSEALAAVRKIIPPHAEAMTASSTTLIEIGLEDHIAEGASGWNILHAKITAENDPVKRAELLRKSVTAEYFISRSNAIARTGEKVACDASDKPCRRMAICGRAPYPCRGWTHFLGSGCMSALLENIRVQKAYGTPGMIGKCVILAHEKNEGRHHPCSGQ